MKTTWKRAKKALGVALVVVGVLCNTLLGMRASQSGLNAPRSPEMPQFENTRLVQRAAKGRLDAELNAWAASATPPQWLAYAAPAIKGDGDTCCGGDWNGNGSCGICRLEDGSRGNTFSSAKTTIALEGPRKIIVLYRAEGTKIRKIRFVSEDCTLDAGGLQVTWLASVNPAQSVEFLAGFVRNSNAGPRNGESLEQSALAAIAMHADPEADRTMQSFVDPEQPESLRKRAAFWLGVARGASGEKLLEKMAKGDPSAEVRAHVAFALSVSKEPEALDEMIRMAHDDSSAHVRGQALFWLAQKAGAKAERTITGAIENDPDTEVKKKAVFALSQMPKGEGVPKLIEVAQTNRNPEVRKQAMFWLGQSGDPRALAFFEEVLAK